MAVDAPRQCFGAMPLLVLTCFSVMHRLRLRGLHPLAQVAGRAAVTTTLAGAAGGVSCLVYGFVRHRGWDLVRVDGRARVLRVLCACVSFGLLFCGSTIRLRARAAGHGHTRPQCVRACAVCVWVTSGSCRLHLPSPPSGGPVQWHPVRLCGRHRLLPREWGRAPSIDIADILVLVAQQSSWASQWRRRAAHSPRARLGARLAVTEAL
jgi:hypothetical protein